MKLRTVPAPNKEQKDFAKLVEEGNYYNEIDTLIRNSVTASMIVSKFKEFCVLENLPKERKPLWDKVVDEYVKYGHFTLWCEYLANGIVKDAFFRQSKNYRAKEQDDAGNVSQFLNIKTDAKFPAFNNSKKAIESQFKEVGGFENFGGQIYQFNKTTGNYQFSVFAPAYKWLQIENDTPTYINESSKNALFGNNLFIMNKTAEKSVDENGNVVLTKTDMVLQALKGGKGVDNTAQNYVLEVEADEDLDKIFKKIELGNTIDIDKFNNVDDKASKKICTAGYCFPQILCNPSEGLFGNSGEAYKIALETWKQTCKYHAEKIKEAFEEIGINLLQQ